MSLPLGRERVARRGAIGLAVAANDERKIGATQPCRGFGDRRQYRLQIEGRSADRFKHVAGRGLVFERFLQIAGATAQFVEEPRVFHGDDRLHREILQQRDLFSLSANGRTSFGPATIWPRSTSSFRKATLNKVRTPAS